MAIISLILFITVIWLSLSGSQCPIISLKNLGFAAHSLNVETIKKFTSLSEDCISLTNSGLFSKGLLCPQCHD